MKCLFYDVDDVIMTMMTKSDDLIVRMIRMWSCKNYCLWGMWKYVNNFVTGLMFWIGVIFVQNMIIIFSLQIITLIFFVVE